MLSYPSEIVAIGSEGYSGKWEVHMEDLSRYYCSREDILIMEKEVIHVQQFPLPAEHFCRRCGGEVVLGVEDSCDSDEYKNGFGLTVRPKTGLASSLIIVFVMVPNVAQ